MHLGHRNCEYSYYMDGITLEALELEKDLGITISKDLTKYLSNANKPIQRLVGCWVL